MIGGGKNWEKKIAKAILQEKNSQRPSSWKKKLKGNPSGKKNLKPLLKGKKKFKIFPLKKKKISSTFLIEYDKEKNFQSHPLENFKRPSWKKNFKRPRRGKKIKRLPWGKQKFASDIFSALPRSLMVNPLEVVPLTCIVLTRQQTSECEASQKLRWVKITHFYYCLKYKDEFIHFCTRIGNYLFSLLFHANRNVIFSGILWNLWLGVEEQNLGE